MEYINADIVPLRQKGISSIDQNMQTREHNRSHCPFKKGWKWVPGQNMQNRVHKRGHCPFKTERDKFVLGVIKYEAILRLFLVREISC
jgi:hypothetical protein